ncbi:MAG: YgiT-type zinc finger protein [Burkholderiales bacterium]
MAEPSTGSKAKRWSSLAKPAPSSSSLSTLSSHRCASCGERGVQRRTVSRSFGAGKALLVIEGIPMWSCPHCGESYFTAQTMHEVKRIKVLRISVAVDRSVPDLLPSSRGSLHTALKPTFASVLAMPSSRRSSAAANRGR